MAGRDAAMICPAGTPLRTRWLMGVASRSPPPRWRLEAAVVSRLEAPQPGSRRGPPLKQRSACEPRPQAERDL